VNCIRHDTQAGKAHRDIVNQLADEAMQIRHDFLTRARLDTLQFKKHEQLVADFVDMTEKKIVEVADSEKDENLEHKQLMWESLGFTFEVVRV